MIHVFFTGGKDPGSVPGEGIKILLQATAHCCLAEIRITKALFPALACCLSDTSLLLPSVQCTPVSACGGMPWLWVVGDASLSFGVLSVPGMEAEGGEWGS